jgi:hypothetical protein
MNFRSLMIAVGLACVAAPAFADPRDDVLGKIAKCAEIADMSARLACFDQQTPDVKAVLGIADTAAAPSQVAPPQAAAAPVQAQPQQQAQVEDKKERGRLFGLLPRRDRDRDIGDQAQTQGESEQTQTSTETFGSEQLPPTEEEKAAAEQERAESLTAGIADYALNPLGRFTIFLDNGQIWQQAQGDTKTAKFNKPPGTNRVEITRGALWSYSAKINDRGGIFKVHRIK